MKGLVEMALALGALYLGISFGLPLAFAGVAWNRYNAKDFGWAGGCAIAAVITLVISLSSYTEAVDACNQLQSRVNIDKALDRLSNRQRVSPSEFEYTRKKCADLPFT